MKVKVIANELVDTDVTMVSLVKHGANRCPFKVLKSDEPESKTLGEKLSSFLKLTKDECRIAAYFVRPDADQLLRPVLGEQGVDVSQREEAEGIVIYKQGDVPARGFVQLNAGLAVGIDQSLDEFREDLIAKAYTQEIQVSGFLPGVTLAASTLADAVWTIFNKSNELEARAESVDAMFGSLRKYVSALARFLPEQIFSVEAATRGLVTEDPIVTKPADAVEKVEKTESADVAKSEASTASAGDPADSVVGDGSGAASAAAADTAASPVDSASGAADSVETVAKAPETDLGKLLTAVAALTTAVDAMVKRQDQVEAKLNTVEEVAKTAETEAKQKVTVYKSVDVDDDFTYANLGGARRGTTIEKSDDEMWGGVLSDLTQFRSNR